jgi:hypothetical protein
MTGVCLCDLFGNGEGTWAFPRLCPAAHMLRVMRNHRRAAHGQTEGYEKLSVLPVALDHATLDKLGEKRRSVVPARRLHGTARSPAVSRTATATRRPPSSRPPAPSAW